MEIELLHQQIKQKLRPPSLRKASRVLSKKLSLSQWLTKWTDDIICKTLVSKEVFEVSRGTSVENLVRNAVKSLRQNANKMTPSWRWKAMKLLPMNLIDGKHFVRECSIKKPGMRRFLLFLAEEIVPEEIFGKRNREILMEWLVDYMYCLEGEQTLMKYPQIITMDCVFCRAMRSGKFKESCEKNEENLVDCQSISQHFLTDFVTKLLLCVAMQFLHQFKQWNSYEMKEEVTFYSRRGLAYWSKREIQKFRDSYKMELSEEKSFINIDNWNISRELKFISQALDYHINLKKDPSYSDSPFGDVAKLYKTTNCFAQLQLLKNYLYWLRKNRYVKQKYYFITCDVCEYFSTVIREKLRQFLVDLVENRTVVVGRTFARLAGSSRYTPFFASAETESQAYAKLMAAVERRRQGSTSIESDAIHIEFRHFSPRIVDDIMEKLDGLKFQFGGRRSAVYRMGKGIPQGYSLSQKLSNMYLMNFDKEYLLPLFSGDTRIFRFVDDYLIITDRKSVALNLLKSIQKPNNYGLRFRKEKIMLSFPVRGYKHCKDLAWCGQKISSTKLVVWKPGKKRATLIPMARQMVRNDEQSQRMDQNMGISVEHLEIG